MTVRRYALPLLPLLLLAAGSACIRGTLPPREMYRLTVPDSLTGAAARDDGTPREGAEAAAARPALDGTLGVVAYETPGLYGERSIVFRIGEAEYAAYPSREWALPLGDMLGHLTARLAAGRALTRDAPIYAPPSPRAQTYLWRARVREFEEVDRGSSLLVSVRIDASIVRSRDDSVVWTASLGREQPVTGGSDMRAVVRALSATAASVIGDLLARAERELPRAGAAGGLGTPAADTARRAP